MDQPTTGDDIAFWAQLVLANVWIAEGQGLWGIPFVVMALAIRGPYWLLLLKRWRAA
ncbi:MAG: hypothetical protein ACRC1H_19395 [Caldilineaceae bacterium]